MDDTYDIAPYDPTVKQDPDLFDSAETGPSLYDTAENAMRQIPVAEPVDEPTPSPTPATLSAAENVPAPIPPPDPLPFLNDEPAPPSDAELEDAWEKLKPGSNLPPEEAKIYGDKLRRGAEAQKNRDIAKTKENIKNMYRTPDGVLQMSKDPTIRREMDASPDDDLVTKRALNRSYLATMYNRPDASPEELDILMRAHSITHWGLNNPSHETFYTKTKEDVLKADEADKVGKSLITTMASTILEDQLASKHSSLGETFEKFAAANPKVITAQNKDQWYQKAMLIDERLRKLGENVRFPAAELIDLSSRVMAGTATELDYDRATNALRNVNPKDLTQIMKVAALAVREKDPNGEMISTIMGNIGKRFDRDFTLTKVYNRTRDNLIGDQFDHLKAGWTVGKDDAGRLAVVEPGRPLPPGVQPLPDKEYKAYWNELQRAQDGMQISRQIQQFQETVADPIVPVFEGGILGAAEAGVYDIAGFSKLIPLSLISSPLGEVAVGTLVAASTYHDLRLENPNLDRQTANDWANLDGLANAIGMKFKADFILGHYPIFKTMRQLKGLGKTTEALKVYGRWAAVHNIEENFEELAQDTTSAVIAKLYGDAHPNEVKQQSWESLLINIAKTRPQVAMAVGPLSLIGAGFATVRDMKNPMRSFMNPDALKSVGLNDEAVAEVLASKDLDEAGKIFRKHYNTLTEKDIKRGFEYAASLTQKDEVDAAMADPALPTIDPVVLPDGTYKYNVLSPEGTILSTHTDPDTAEIAWAKETERVRGEQWAAEQTATAQQAAAEAAAAASDEGVAKEAEAKAEAETVSPEDRLGTAMTVEFEPHAAPTPEESREVSQLQADVQAAGRSDVIVLARPSNAQAGPGQASLSFIRAFERATGKRVVFVASGNDQPLSFTGVVRKGDPNTIFLDAHGDRNVLALVGHEWSHTLEHTSPELHAEMVGRMKPLIVEWAKQEGILAKEVGPEGVTNEMVANIVGDAISNENFWTVMAQKDPSLFAKVRDAVLKFLNQFIGKVQKSEFGTEAFIKDATQMRAVVADIMNRAGQGAEAAATAEGVTFAGRKGQQRMAGEKGEREVAGKGYIEKHEIAQIAIDAAEIMKTASPEMIKVSGGKEKMLAEIKRQVRTDVLAQRIKFPDATVPDVKSPWSPIVYKGIVFEARETAPGFKAVAGWEKEPYSYEEPPEGVSREEWVNTLAKRSTQQFIERLQKGFGKGASQKAQENAQTILDSIEWYRDFVELVRGEWGGFSDLMADFLGAFSPNQNVRLNWRNAVDAIYGLSHGKYDQLFTELDAFLKADPTRTIKDWRKQNGQLMMAKSGALFGTNTELGHLAALDMWRAIQAGDAPKAKNFTRNLIGLSIRATIDLWAARLLQRVAEKPRVAGVAKMGIRGRHVIPKKGQEIPVEESVSGQFKFGQDVMAVVADQMRDPRTWDGTGIDGSLFRYVTPADVQAMNWFVEKEIWWDNGWTNDEGSGGSMIYELNQERSTRFVAGLSQEISYREGHADYIPQHPQQAAFTRDIWNSLRKAYPDALAIRVMDSIGSFMGGRERSTDLEMVHGPGMDPDAMMKEILYQAYAKDQSSAFISRVMKMHEADEDGNARPGLEFYFKERVTREQMEPVLAFLRSRGIDGFTLIVDRRTSPDPEGGPNEFWGARLQYIPEFTGDENWQQKAVEYREAMKIAGRLIDGMQGVAYVGVVRYDTLVLQKGLHYDDSGIYPGALSGSESRAWRRRSVDATAEEATGLSEQAEGAVAGQPLPSGEPGQGRRGRPPPTGQVAFAGRRAAAVEAETAARVAEPEGRVAFFQKIRDRVVSLMKEHDTRREGRLPPQKLDPANELARLDNAVRAKMEGIDRREQAALDKVALRVLGKFGAPSDTETRLQDLENQRQSEIEAAERDWQKTFSRASKNISDLTFQQRLVTFEKIRGLERQYKERLRGIRNVYRERGRALIQAAATDKAEAETAIRADTRLASEIEKRFDVERREAERQHELRQKQIERRAELRTQIGQQAFEAKEARRRLIESIGEFNAMLKALPEELRGKIGGVVEVARITDEEEMAKFFAQRIARIDEVLEHHLRQGYQERINDLLATYKPKKSPGGVLSTKIGDAQQVVDDIRGMTKMDDVAVAAEIANIEAKINSGTLSPEEEAAAHQRQNLLSLFGDLENRNAATLATSHQFLKSTIAQGRAAWGAIEETRLANQRANGMAIRASLGPSSGALAAARRDKIDRWKGAAASMYNFGQLMHDLFPDLPFVQNWVDRSRDADSAIQDFMIDVDKRFSDLVRQFSGNSVINGGAALKALNNRTIDVPGGKASKLEAIQYLLSWAQADAQVRMVRDGWTDDHIETLRRETDDPLSKAISQFLRKEYDEAYPKINAVYKRMYGMDLPRIAFYAPLRYEHSGIPEDVAPFGSPTSISGSTATFMHARVKHSASLKQMDALTVYMQHMQQAAHFIHYAELVREMRGTLNNGEVKEAIGSNMGPYQVDAMNKWMDIIARGGTAKASEMQIMKDATSYLTKGTAIGALALNVKSAVSQLDSAFRWMYEIPPRAWLPAFLKPGWISTIPQVWGSDPIQRRIHDGMNPISQYLMSTNNMTPGLLLKMTRLGMAPLRYTDAAGTTISSAIVFKYHYDQLIKGGASVEDATEQAAVLMDRAVHKFSQPTSLTSKSIVENTQTGVAKASLLFMSDPRMKTALLMEAFGDFRRGDIEMGVGKIVAGMAMGVLTLLAANLFRDWATDDDDEDIWTLAGFLNAMSFGQFHGVFIAGNVIDYVGTSGLAWLTGEKAPYYGARGDILTETYKRAERILKDPSKLWSDDPEEMIKTWENVLRVMGIVVPPVAQLAGLANLAKTALGVSENLEKSE